MTEQKVSNPSLLRVTQIMSAIRRKKEQRATLISLGLNKLHRTRYYPDIPSIRGRLNKVKHLLQIVKQDEDL